MISSTSSSSMDSSFSADSTGNVCAQAGHFATPEYVDGTRNFWSQDGQATSTFSSTVFAASDFGFLD